MNERFEKFLKVGVVSVVAAMSIGNALAASPPPVIVDGSPACMIVINSNKSTTYLNVLHIAKTYINKDEANIIYVDSSRGVTTSIKYENAESAGEALVKMADNINNCKEDAMARRLAMQVKAQEKVQEAPATKLK